MGQTFDWGAGKYIDDGIVEYVRDPRLDYDVFGHIVQKPYPLPSPFRADDILANNLNQRFSYNAPDIQPLARIEGGPGYDITKNPFGSWDLGNGTALIPKWKMQGKTPQDMDAFFTTKNDFTNPDHYKPLLENGLINPDGWEVVSTKSNAVGHIIGTLGVLSAAAGSYFFGPAGETANLAANSESMMIGSAAGNVPGASAFSGSSPLLKIGSKIAVASLTDGMGAAAAPAIGAGIMLSANKNAPSNIDARNLMENASPVNKEPATESVTSSETIQLRGNNISPILFVGVALLVYWSMK